MQPSKDLVHIGAEAIAFLGIIVYNQYKFNALQKQIDELKQQSKTTAEYIALLESKLAIELSQRAVPHHPQPVPSHHHHHHVPQQPYQVPPPRNSQPPRHHVPPPQNKVEIVEEEDEKAESEEAEEEQKMPEQVLSSRRRAPPKPVKEEKKTAAPPPELSKRRSNPKEEKPKSKRSDEGREEGSNKIKERMARTKQIAEQMRKKREESLKGKE